MQVIWQHKAVIQLKIYCCQKLFQCALPISENKISVSKKIVNYVLYYLTLNNKEVVCVTLHSFSNTCVGC